MARPRLDETAARPVYVRYECRRFCVDFGHRCRNTVQVRLEPDNETVCLSYTKVDGMDIHSCRLPLSRFIEAVESLVDAHQEANVSDDKN